MVTYNPIVDENLIEGAEAYGGAGVVTEITRSGSNLVFTLDDATPDTGSTTWEDFNVGDISGYRGVSATHPASPAANDFYYRPATSGGLSQGWWQYTTSWAKVTGDAGVKTLLEGAGNDIGVYGTSTSTVAEDDALATIEVNGIDYDADVVFYYHREADDIRQTASVRVPGTPASQLQVTGTVV